MSFDKKHNSVHCFGCGATYDIFDLVGLEYNLTSGADKFRKTYEALGISLGDQATRFPKQTAANPTAGHNQPADDYTKDFQKWRADASNCNYLQTRGISQKVCSRFQIGYCASWKSPTAPRMKPKPVIIIPTSSQSYIARSIHPNEPKQYRFMKVGASRLFHIDALYNKQDKPAFIVEGEIDALSVMEVDGESVALGSTANTRLLIDTCKKKAPALPLILCLDNDEAGQKATKTLKEELDKLGVPYLIKTAPNEKDPNAALMNDREGFADFIQEAMQEALSLQEKLKNSVAGRLAGYHLIGYTVNENGVYAEKASGENVCICPTAVIPTAIIENITTGIEKIELSFYKNSRWRLVICDRATAASYSKIIELANRGLEVNSDNARVLVKYIASFVNHNHAKLPHHHSVSQMGWASDRKEFMPFGTALYFDGEESHRQLYQSITQAGTLQDWINFITPLRQNLYLRLIMAASFASPLIELTNALPFVFHLWGGTGVGKTVALSVAMSVWGNPRTGAMVRSMNQTVNSMLSTAAFLNSIPFAGDELQTIKSKWNGNFDQLVMCLTEGIDRGRMTYDKMNELKAWHCAFLFTGEEPCTKATSGGGVKNRVIEVECREKVVENGNQVINFICDNYGHAGVEYIALIKKNADIIKQQFHKYHSEILGESDTTDKQASSVALMVTADALARKLFFPEEKPLQMADIQPFLFSGKEVAAHERAYSYILDIIARNHAKFTIENTDNAYGEIWGKYDDDGNCLIIKTVLTEQLEKAGFDFDAVKGKWAENGYLIRNSQGKMLHFTTCFGRKAKYIKLLMPE